MHEPWSSRRARRTSPRVGVEALCTEIVDGRERHALLADVSDTGLRLTRPFFGGPTPRVVQLEFELPGIDEVMWAKGEVCFDQVQRGAAGIVRTSGVRFAAAAAHDLRLVRDYVFELWHTAERDAELAFLGDTTRWTRG